MQKEGLALQKISEAQLQYSLALKSGFMSSLEDTKNELKEYHVSNMCIEIYICILMRC
jgi:hypothetical protein